MLADFEKVGDQIEMSHRSWESAKNKLATGKGNLINAVQKIKNLGANASKSIPANYLDDKLSSDDDEQLLPEKKS